MAYLDHNTRGIIVIIIVIFIFTRPYDKFFQMSVKESFALGLALKVRFLELGSCLFRSMQRGLLLLLLFLFLHGPMINSFR